ncbi:MAG TPA: hypothetical protein VIY26_15440, partial [Acidimicrobiales bacterium]
IRRMERIGDDLGYGSRRRRGASKAVRSAAAAAPVDAPASRDQEIESALVSGETVLASAPFRVREAHGSVGEIATAVNVALVVTDRRLLFFETSGSKKRTGELQHELPLRVVDRAITKGTKTEIFVEGGLLTVEGVGLASQQTRQHVLRALGATTRSPSEVAELRREREAAWRDFADLGGTHLAVRRTSLSSQSVVTAEGELLCSSRRRGGELSIGDRLFVAHQGAKPFKFAKANPPYEVLDASSERRVLYVGSRNYNLRASGVVCSTSHRYTFPVSYSGSPWRWLRFPVMSAVDETGRTVALYRKARSQNQRSRGVEVVVDADDTLNDELLLLLATTAPFLDSFFQRPGGGG